MAGSAGRGGAGGSFICVFNGTSHALGTTFPDSDGCNSCSCTSNGIACTARACAPDAGSDGPSDGPSDGGVCSYGGMTYSPGSTFPSPDGCNQCTCGSTGLVSCTKVNCQPPQDGGSCALPEVYAYGDIGGHISYQDHVVIGTTGYMYSRVPSGPTQEPATCAPPLPACNTPNAIDLADINRDLADPDVQAALQAALHRPLPALYGVDMRPSDGTVFLVPAIERRQHSGRLGLPGQLVVVHADPRRHHQAGRRPARAGSAAAEGSRLQRPSYLTRPLAP